MRRLIDNGTTPPARLPHIGHYGHLRKSYLEGYRPDLYTALAASEKLYEHCAEIDAAARSRIDLIMPEFAKSAGATEELKAADPMKWVGLLNACKAQAEEIVKYELKVKGLYSEKTGKTYDATVLLSDTGGKYVNYRIATDSIM